MKGKIIGLIVILALNLFAGSLLADAQQPGKIPRIGLLTGSGPSNPGNVLYVQKLRDLGYVDGQNVALEWRYANGNLNRLPDLATELVRLPVDIIGSGGSAASLAAQRATTTIPIVFCSAGNPLGRGLVTNLARPGGNITGVAFDTGLELISKRIELFKQTVPTITRVAYVIGNTRSPSSDNQRKADEIRERTARSLGLTIQTFRVRQIAEFEARVFPAIKADPHPFDALFVVGPLVSTYRRQLADFALQNRLPMMGHWEPVTKAGALLSYATNIEDMIRRCAVLMSKVLQGANPGDLPVEQPSKYDFVINLKTAKALGVTIPPTVLYQATKVLRQGAALPSYHTSATPLPFQPDRCLRPPPPRLICNL